MEEESQLVKLPCNHSLPRKNTEMSLLWFWCSAAAGEYPILDCQAIEVILPFSTTYLCKTGFSALTLLKNKSRNRLDVVHDFRIALTAIRPNFDKLIKEKQAQVSHEVEPRIYYTVVNMFLLMLISAFNFLTVELL
ncbi:unnamed protein product [Eretmochelys imbricata]